MTLLNALTLRVSNTDSRASTAASVRRLRNAASGTSAQQPPRVRAPIHATLA